MDLILDHIYKTYQHKTVLSDFSAVFKESACSVIMGSSGCGKTTLLRILMGFEAPDTGRIEGLPKHLSAVFQEDRLCEDFDAVTNVRIAAAPSISEKDIIKGLGALGLTDSLHQPVRNLSGGMKRRVSILRSLMADADLILMDEPFKGLDLLTKTQTMTYVKNSLRNRTVIMVTHDEKEALFFSDPSHIITISP